MTTTAAVEPDTPGSVPLRGTCGARAVMRDAWVVFDPTTGSWRLGSVFDSRFCDTCGRETRLRRISEAEDRKRRRRHSTTPSLGTDAIEHRVQTRSLLIGMDPGQRSRTIENQAPPAALRRATPPSPE